MSQSSLIHQDELALKPQLNKSLAMVFLFLLLLTVPLSLMTEISSLTIECKPTSRENSSQTMMTRHLHRMEEIAHCESYNDHGQTAIAWKALHPLLAPKLRTALSWCEETIDKMVIKVVGTIEVENGDLYLRSIGDESRFLLRSKGCFTTHLTTIPRNMTTSPLEKKIKELLLQAEKTHSVVEIEGDLFLSYRPQLNIIVHECRKR